jgi:excisionase family DNA binding protein
MNFTSKSRKLDSWISVKDAAEFSGYSLQYLRRLLRNGKIEGFKIGQVWLIEIDTFEKYVKLGENSNEK